ncbi:MAG TPA: hypothetical protein VGD43_08360 [Micromonospora sp.]
MSRPDGESEEAPRTEPICHPPTANPARTQLGPTGLDAEPDEADPIPPPQATEEA